MFKNGGDPSNIVEDLDLIQIDNINKLEDLVIKVIISNPQQVKQYKDGKESLLNFFVGKVMLESKGKANPKKIEKILKEKLD